MNKMDKIVVDGCNKEFHAEIIGNSKEHEPYVWIGDFKNNYIASIEESQMDKLFIKWAEVRGFQTKRFKRSIQPRKIKHRLVS